MDIIDRIDKISELIDASAADHERLEAENARLKTLIKAADCPNCDKSGAYYDGQGEVIQCRWCYEYNQLMKE